MPVDARKIRFDPKSGAQASPAEATRGCVRSAPGRCRCRLHTATRTLAAVATRANGGQVGGNGLVAVPVGQHLPDRGRRPPRADVATPEPLATQPQLPDTGERRAAWAAWPAPAGSRPGGSQARRRRAWGQAKHPDAHWSFAHRSHPPEHFRSGAAPTSRAINLTTTRQGLHAVLLCVSVRVDARHRCSVDTANAAVPKPFLFSVLHTGCRLFCDCLETAIQKTHLTIQNSKESSANTFLADPNPGERDGSGWLGEPTSSCRADGRTVTPDAPRRLTTGSV